MEHGGTGQERALPEAPSGYRIRLVKRQLARLRLRHRSARSVESRTRLSGEIRSLEAELVRFARRSP